MKTSSLWKIALAIVTLLGFYGVSPTVATADEHPGVWDARHHYRRDNYGYWDDHDRYHHYERWHDHQGYWDDRGGVRVFIRVD